VLDVIIKQQLIKLQVQKHAFTPTLIRLSRLAFKQKIPRIGRDLEFKKIQALFKDFTKVLTKMINLLASFRQQTWNAGSDSDLLQVYVHHMQ